MKEIGGYIELDNYRNPMLHEDAIRLNSAKNCLVYLIRHKCIRKIHIPFFLCDSVLDTCKENGVEVIMYHVDENLNPILNEIEFKANDWLYLVNYYGQMESNFIKRCKKRFLNIIVDNVQAYYTNPIDDIDTFYSCRKYFGVPDGALLYSDIRKEKDLPVDKSYYKMGFLLGRYEVDANTFYKDYVENNKLIRTEPLMRMSRLTENLLRGVDYEFVRERRTENFIYLDMRLNQHNKLNLKNSDGPFAYPFFHDKGSELRKELLKKKIYLPVLWPNVTNIEKNYIEKEMALNILPLPCDQRYSEEDMRVVSDCILERL